MVAKPRASRNRRYPPLVQRASTETEIRSSVKNLLVQKKLYEELRDVPLQYLSEAEFKYIVRMLLEAKPDDG